MSSTNMTTSTIVKTIAGVGILLGVLAFFGFTPFGKEVVTQFVGSPAGTTGQTAKYYSVTQTFTTSTSTAPLLNGDASDRFASQVRYECTGLGTSQQPYIGGGMANLTLFAATSSSATASTTNTNYMFVSNIATTSTRALVASSTLVLSGTIPTSAWASGSYLWFYTNATSTMTCTIGVDTIPS